MDERKAAALLKARFEAAGCKIEENRRLAEAGVDFEIDGYDPDTKVGYEYVTEEAGDSWDVDGNVIAALDQARDDGKLYIFVMSEGDAPDDKTLGAAADGFLAELVEAGVITGGAKKEAKPKAKAKPKADAKPKAEKKGKKR